MKVAGLNPGDDGVEMLAGTIDLLGRVRHLHERIGLVRLGSPVEKEPFHSLTVAAFQNVRVGQS